MCLYIRNWLNLNGHAAEQVHEYACACPVTPYRAAEVVTQFPKLMFMLEHCGLPMQRDQAAMKLWKEGRIFLTIPGMGPSLQTTVDEPYLFLFQMCT